MIRRVEEANTYKSSEVFSPSHYKTARRLNKITCRELDSNLQVINFSPEQRQESLANFIVLRSAKASLRLDHEQIYFCDNGPNCCSA